MKDIDTIDPHILWYMVGYIATDGSLSIDGRHVSITSKDREHLEKIKRELEITSKIIMKSRGNSEEKIYSVLQIGGVKSYRFLNSIGMRSRKTWNMGKLDIDMRYFNDFLRGVIDGDGCVYSWKHKSNNHTQWSLRISGAAPKFINWLLIYTEEYFSVKGKIYVQKCSNKSDMYIIKFGKLATQKIISLTYYKDSFCLERKLTKVLECLHDSAKMVKYGGVICSGGETGYTQQT
jgi:hypothetical protein